MEDATNNHSQTVSEDEALLEAVRLGKDSADAGHVVPSEKVREWLLSWGTEHKLPPPAVDQDVPADPATR